MPKIIYEDNHLLVLDKPAGLLTQPSGTDFKSLEAEGKQWLKETYKKQGNVFLEAIHRLDQAASGIVVFAKTSKALSRLMEAIRQRKAKKFYYAQVEKPPPDSQGRLVHYLIHCNRRADIVGKDDPEGKRASLFYRVIQEGEKPVLDIELETGRYHQIRCQLSAIGSPILGDFKYGAQIPYSHKGIALHHCRMVIPHPITQKDLILDSPFAQWANYS